MGKLKKVSRQQCFNVSSPPDVLLLVLLLGTVLQDPREFDIIKESALNWCLSVHLVDVLFGGSEFSRNECLFYEIFSLNKLDVRNLSSPVHSQIVNL